MFNFYRWPPISWWSCWGSHLGQEIIYHFGKHGWYSSPPIMSSCMPTHVMVMTIPPNGLNLTFPIIAMSAIPCPNMLLNHQIIWWTLTIGDLSCPPLSGPMSGLWKLHPQIYNELRTSVISFTDHVTKYQQSVLDKQHSSILQPPIKWIQQVLNQRHSVQMSFCHIKFVVQDLQRMWLHVWGILNYMEIYKPHMDGWEKL